MALTSDRMALYSRRAMVAMGLCAALTPQVFAQADDYPSKPIRLIVPFPPGGGTDLIARTVAQKITEQAGWNIVIENRPGAGGNLGVDAAAKSAPDGYTLVLGQTSNLAINPSLYKKLPYEPLKDLTPVALLSSSPILMVTAVGSKFRTMSDVIQAAKAQPDVVTVGYAGNGTVAHLAATQAEQAAGIKLRHVPYKGIAMAMTDIGGGQVDLFMGSVPSLLGQIRTGKMHPVMVTSKQRSGQLPQTATMAEAGFPGFDAITWFGVLAPAGTNPAIVNKLNAAINKALSEKDVGDKLRAEGGEILGGSANDFAKLLQSEMTRWAQVVQASGASIN